MANKAIARTTKLTAVAEALECVLVVVVVVVVAVDAEGDEVVEVDKTPPCGASLGITRVAETAAL
jgi:hypothetical protein